MGEPHRLGRQWDNPTCGWQLLWADDGQLGNYDDRVHPRITPFHAGIQPAAIDSAS
jgi:hypothetical protein